MGHQASIKASSSAFQEFIKKWAAARQERMRQSLETILAELPEKPPRSRLDPYLELIQELRMRKWTFKQIADLLAEKVGVRVTGSAVHDFLRRRSRLTGSSPKNANVYPGIRSERSKTGGAPPVVVDAEFDFSIDEPLRIRPKNG